MSNRNRTARLHAAIEPLLADKSRIVASVRPRYLLETLEACRSISVEFRARKGMCATLHLSASLRHLGMYDEVEVNWSAWGSQTPDVALEFAALLTSAANVAATLQAILDEEQPTWSELTAGKGK